ncbi:hypothetical protein [Singulisphaera sp. PoT]|uniref:hypothetical protein n=1 Tax=Singulisphaera sp. PoT TaxID=3411797 RepID=UPI003BF61178
MKAMLIGFLKVCGGTILGGVLGSILGSVLVPPPEAGPDEMICGLMVLPNLVATLFLGVVGAMIGGITTLIITLTTGAMQADEAVATAVRKPQPIAEV